MEIRPIWPDEYEEAGEATVAAYAPFGPATAANGEIRASIDWDAYNAGLMNIARRVEVGEVWVAVDGGRILGSVGLEFDERFTPGAPRLTDASYIRMLGIAPWGQGRGAGRALTERLIERSREEGKHRVTLQTTNMMAAAVGLYASLGFKVTEKEQIDEVLTLLWLERQL